MFQYGTVGLVIPHCEGGRGGRESWMLFGGGGNGGGALFAVLICD